MAKSERYRESVATTQLPALKRGRDKPKPHLKAKHKKRERRHPWYDQFDEVHESAEPDRDASPVLVRLAESLDRDDEDGALGALVEIQETLDRNEDELRQANSRVRYAEATLADLEGEYARLRDWADARSYSVEGAGPRMQGGIAQAHGSIGLLAAMGIDQDLI